MSVQLRKRVYEANRLRCFRITKDADLPLTLRVPASPSGAPSPLTVAERPQRSCRGERREGRRTTYPQCVFPEWWSVTTEKQYPQGYDSPSPVMPAGLPLSPIPPARNGAAFTEDFTFKSRGAVWSASYAEDETHVFAAPLSGTSARTSETWIRDFSWRKTEPLKEAPPTYNADPNVSRRATAYYAKWVGSADLAEVVWAKAYKRLHATELRDNDGGIKDALSYAFSEAWHNMEPREGLSLATSFVAEGDVINGVTQTRDMAYALNAYRLEVEVVRLAIDLPEYGLTAERKAMYPTREDGTPTAGGVRVVVNDSGADVDPESDSGWNPHLIEWKDLTGDTACNAVCEGVGEPRFSNQEVERKWRAINAEYERDQLTGGPEYARLQMEWATADAEHLRASSRAQLARYGAAVVRGIQ